MVQEIQVTVMDKAKRIEKAAKWLSRAEQCESREEALKCIRKYTKHQNKLIEEDSHETIQHDQGAADQASE